jgi:hypothetical protein
MQKNRKYNEEWVVVGRVQEDDKIACRHIFFFASSSPFYL